VTVLQSSGREPWIFRVDRPEDLVGRHCELIANAAGDEPILHLIYSPAWEGTKAPFGITGHSASYAVALTASRWIISEDRHESWSEPRVRAIPLADVLVIEKGSALLQAWLVIRFREGDALQRITILHKAIGSHHFDDAIRTYRRLAAAAKIVTWPHESTEWQQVPRYLAQELVPLLVDGEHLLASTHTAEEWHDVRRRWRRVEHCARPWSGLLLTDRGIVYGEAETPRRPSELAFGVNVWCAPPAAIRVMQVVAHSSEHCEAPALRITLTRGSVRHDFDAAMPSETAGSAFAAAMNGHG